MPELRGFHRCGPARACVSCGAARSSAPRWSGLVRARPWPARAVLRPGDPVGEVSVPPLRRALPGDVHRLRGGGDRPARLDPFAQSRASFGCEWGVTVHKSLLWQVRLPSTAPHSPGGHLIQDPASTTSQGTTPRPDGRHRARGRFRSRCRRDGRRLRGDLHRVPMDRGYLHPHPAFLGGTILGQRFLSTIMWLFASSWRSAPPGRPTAAPPRE